MSDRIEEKELNGYIVTKTDIEALLEYSNVKISFLIGNMPEWGTIKFGQVSYFNTQLEKLISKSSTGKDIKSHEHDCGDPNCPAIGETYIIESSKLKTIARTLT